MWTCWDDEKQIRVVLSGAATDESGGLLACVGGVHLTVSGNRLPLLGVALGPASCEGVDPCFPYNADTAGGIISCKQDDVFGSYRVHVPTPSLRIGDMQAGCLRWLVVYHDMDLVNDDEDDDPDLILHVGPFFGPCGGA